MPRRLAPTGPYHVAVVEYDDPPLKPGEVLVQTELASGKHGTTMAMFDGGVFRGQRLIRRCAFSSTKSRRQSL